MMHWHFGADAAKGTGNIQQEIWKKKQKRKEGKKKEAQKGRWRARPRFGRLSKTFIIFDGNDQTP